MQAVVVGVKEHLVADGGQRHDARIHADVVLAGGEVVAAGKAVQARVGVEQVVGADVGGGQHGAVGGHELHDVVTRDEPGEAVVAVGIGLLVGAHLHARGVVHAGEQAHRDALHTGFAAVLQAVVVGVQENPVADGGQRRGCLH